MSFSCLACQRFLFPSEGTVCFWCRDLVEVRIMRLAELTRRRNEQKRPVTLDRPTVQVNADRGPMFGEGG